jgi:hypothetical protein
MQLRAAIGMETGITLACGTRYGKSPGNVPEGPTAGQRKYSDVPAIAR